MSSTHGLARLEDLSAFDTLIDVRSPAEYAEDHIPGAINCPVLDDEQRARIGTIYTQRSPFEARKLGAALVSENIAAHLIKHFQDKPRTWRPLIYCWRGGQRSGALTLVMRQIGWNACQLIGGYKPYRTSVLKTIAEFPAQLSWQVVCGPTGSGKTALLSALAERGAQILDLEALASHRGSVLGAIPGHPQPSQKGFETAVTEKLRTFDTQKPVFVEAESRKIGRIQVPESLLQVIRSSPCIVIATSIPARIALLLRDYAHLAEDKKTLLSCLESLSALHSKETMKRWLAMAESHELEALLGELLIEHYDPHYAKSQQSNFVRLASARKLELPDLNELTLAAAAETLII